MNALSVKYIDSSVIISSIVITLNLMILISEGYLAVKTFKSRQYTLVASLVIAIIINIVAIVMHVFGNLTLGALAAVMIAAWALGGYCWVEYRPLKENSNGKK